VFAGLGRGPRRGRALLEVAPKRRFDGHALGERPMDVYAAYHFVFSTARPGFGVSLGILNGLTMAGRPVLRMSTVQVLEEILTIVVISTPYEASAASLYRNRT